MEAVESEIKSSQDVGVRYSTFVTFFLVLLAVGLLYVWSHIRMTQLEYQVAEEMSKQEQLMEEQKRLKIEYATLKSPQRIEAIAREKLDMIYPDRSQVVILK